MKAFDNRTTAGNEKAIRRGQIVPEDGINLAYIKAPKLSPKDNVVIVDTSRIVEENTLDPRVRRKLYYANPAGILVDEFGNAAVGDERPAVTDVFSIDEDWITTPGNEYTPESILPFVHVSRYFHVDYAGLTLTSDSLSIQTDAVRVIDSNGKEYLDENGSKRYRIKFVAAKTLETGTNWAYRVFAYVDTDTNEKLYLTYNKVEINTSFRIVNPQINFKELLNPQLVFSYHPEESEVVDSTNRKKRWFSTKPVSSKEQILGKPHPSIDGYKIYVPKKAVGDPRLFQLFRWRVTCHFTQPYKVDTVTQDQAIRCGIVVTNSNPISRAPYALLNLSRSNYNATKVAFHNPHKTSHAAVEQEQASYWYVNMDTEDLSDYDLLLWSPNVSDFDFSPYIGKLDDFVSSKGGTIFIDTNNFTYSTTLGPTMTAAISPASGTPITPGDAHYVNAATAGVVSGSELISGVDTLGGWNLLDNQNNDETQSLSFFQQPTPAGFTQAFLNTDGNYTTVVDALDNTSVRRPVVIASNVGHGHKILSTFGVIQTCGALFDNVSDFLIINANLDATIYNDPNYNLYINSTSVEGAMKFLFNAAMLAVKGRILTDTTDQAYSTSWSYSTDWFSSWTIKAEDDVLSRAEMEENQFRREPKDIRASDNHVVIKRVLSDATIQQLVDRAVEPLMNNPSTKLRVNGGTRTYTMEITNPQVLTTTDIQGTDYPAVWTNAYTPKFTVPADIGPHIIKEQVDETGRKGTVGQYDSGQYSYFAYPDKPYSGQVFAGYLATTESATHQTINWTASGTATETITITEEVPPVMTYAFSDVEFSWWNHTDRVFYQSIAGFEYGIQQTSGLATWQEHNYYSSQFGSSVLNWPFWGMTGRYYQGTSGEVISFIQDFLNTLNYFTVNLHPPGGAYTLPGGSLAIDGVFGPKTKAAVIAFQQVFAARFVDGIVDAETWYLIGNQILRYSITSGGKGGHKQYYDWPYGRMRKFQISDGDPGSIFAKRSMAVDSPPIISDMFMLRFDTEVDIQGATVIPYLEGDADDLGIFLLDVANLNDLAGYNGSGARLANLPYRARNGENWSVPFGPWRGNALVVGLKQDRAAGKNFGEARMFGIRDIRAHVRVASPSYSEPKTYITHQSHTTNISATGTLAIDSFRDVVVQAENTTASAGTLSNFTWTSVSTDNTNVQATIDSLGKMSFRNNIVTAWAGTAYTQGLIFPQTAGTYYSMDENHVINPAPETGFISKAEGLKLLCDSAGHPVGFPSMPTAIGPNEQQQHYTRLTIAGRGNDPKVHVGFYDIAQQEFITNAAYEPDMSFIEYVQRGPGNVYIAIISEHEIPNQNLIPVDSDAPRLPYRWAMPVYGVYTTNEAKITLEPLPPDLGPFDIWPIAVRDGHFNRSNKIRSRLQGYLSGYLGNYQDSVVRAFYSIPEAEVGGYSTIYGPPNYDVKNEEPIILDDDVIQVRQAPILVVAQPTIFPSDADPHRPVFKLYKRTSRTSPWVAQGWSEIKDYNVSTGEIYLRTSLSSNDTSLLKCDYTTARRHYLFKKYGSDLINLNSYSGNSRDLLNKAVYVYLIPEYVQDSDGRIIADSVQSRTLNFAIDPNIFDPLRPEYDPLAVQLGVVYMSTALDVKDVVVLDTRRRGGGARDTTQVEEVGRLVNEASSYWDIGFAGSTSYQKGGFIVVRLPAALKDFFSEQQISEVIRKNISVGVGFKIEDLQGNEWS